MERNFTKHRDTQYGSVCFCSEPRFVSFHTEMTSWCTAATTKNMWFIQYIRWFRCHPKKNWPVDLWMFWIYGTLHWARFIQRAVSGVNHGEPWWSMVNHGEAWWTGSRATPDSPPRAGGSAQKVGEVSVQQRLCTSEQTQCQASPFTQESHKNRPHFRRNWSLHASVSTCFSMWSDWYALDWSRFFTLTWMSQCVSMCLNHPQAKRLVGIASCLQSCSKKRWQASSFHSYCKLFPWVCTTSSCFFLILRPWSPIDFDCHESEQTTNISMSQHITHPWTILVMISVSSSSSSTSSSPFEEQQDRQRWRQGGPTFVGGVRLPLLGRSWRNSVEFCNGNSTLA